MIITYLGVESVKFQVGNLTLVCNPVSKESKWKSARFGADVVLVSLNHSDMNGAKEMEYGDRKPFTIEGAGEYEVRGTFVRGMKSLSRYAGMSRINTIYSFSLDGITVCYLGALGADLEHEVRETLDGVDLLFVPIGGDGTLTAAEANKLAVALEPKLIIPIHFGDVGVKNALSLFLKEAGEGKPEEMEKLTIKKKDLDGKEGEVVVLRPQA